MLATPRVSSSNPAQGIFVGFILCLYKMSVCVEKYVINQKIHPCGMATLKNSKKVPEIQTSLDFRDLFTKQLTQIPSFYVTF